MDSLANISTSNVTNSNDSGLVLNSSTYGADHNVTSTDDSRVSPTVMSVCIVIIVYIFIANCVIVASFIMDRRSSWNGFMQQVLNLAISDVLVAITVIPLIVTGVANLEIPHIVCALSYYLVFAAQNGSLFNILAICIHRAFMLKNIRQPIASTRPNTVLNAGMLVGCWIVSLSVSGAPFLIWSRPDAYQNVCLINNIFGNNVKQAAALLFASYLLPLVVTDVAYAVVCMKLSKAPSPPIRPKPNAGKAISCVMPSASVQASNASNCSNLTHDTNVTRVINSAFNPIVYAVRIKNIKNGVQRIILPCRATRN